MTSLHFFPSGKVEVKMKVVGFDAVDGYSLSQAEIFARRQMIGLIYFLQTRGYKGRILDTHTLASVSRAIGVREQRRIIGEHILTYEEIKHGCIFDDGVAVGTYHTDYHWTDRIQRAGTGILEMLEPYHIPLRCFIPKGAKNLLVPGRGTSAEQMALSSLRVMATVAQMGFAAGKAAEQCVRKKLAIRDMNIPELKDEIEAGGQSLDLSNYGEYLREMLFLNEDVFQENEGFHQCHAPTIVQARNNRFLVAWLGGTREGHSDTGIWLADRFQSVWSEPRLIAKVKDKPHWDPALFRAADRKILLFFKVGVKPEEWTTWLTISTDEGISWSKPTCLENRPDNRAIGPVTNKPIILSDGTWLAPNSIETKNNWDAFADISRDNGLTWSQSEMVPLDHSRFNGKKIIQTSLWESKPYHVHMLLPASCGRMCRSDSVDGGRTWKPAKALSLPNKNTAVDVTKLYDGILALVYNPVSPKGDSHTPLTIALSMDNGETWPHKLDIETGKEQSGSPSIIPTGTGITPTTFSIIRSACSSVIPPVDDKIWASSELKSAKRCTISSRSSGGNL